MKIFSMVAIGALMFWTACSNKKNSPAQENGKDTIAQQVTNTGNKPSHPISAIVTGYLDLKNALANDNGNDAAAAANKIKMALDATDTTTFTAEQNNQYKDLKDDMKEHVEHIGANSSNVPHQREHFDMLSRDMIDLVKAIGSPQDLYSDFCPMYNDKKGAPWLSETKEINNPYYGKKMPTCGEVKEEFKAK